MIEAAYPASELRLVKEWQPPMPPIREGETAVLNSGGPCLKVTEIQSYKNCSSKDTFIVTDGETTYYFERRMMSRP